MRWSGPILTDSGGFQVMSLSALRKMTEDGVTFQSHIDGSTHHVTPERSIEIQCLLGADIQMQLDECIELPATRERAVAAMELSLRWAERSKRAFEAMRSRGRRCSASSRAAPISSFASARPMRSSRWILPAMRSAGSRSARATT